MKPRIMGKILDHFGTLKDFEKLLIEAEKSAYFSWDMDYVNGIRNRYEDYGPAMEIDDDEIDDLKLIIANMNT